MILDIRGTHGSGKSYVVHQLLKKNEHEEIRGRCEHREKDNYVLGYSIPELGAAIIGRYSNICGGTDGVGSVAEIVRRLRLFSRQYRIVVLEGIMVAHTFKRYSDLANELDDYKFLFLNTPLAQCIKRVKQRRVEAGNMKDFNPKNVIHDYNQIWKRVRVKMEEAGHDVIVLNWCNPMPQVMELIENAQGN